MLLDNRLPDSIRLHSFHSEDVLIFLNGHDVSHLQWTEVHAKKGYGVRLGDTKDGMGRREEVRVNGAFSFKWKREYQKRLEEQHMKEMAKCRFGGPIIRPFAFTEEAQKSFDKGREPSDTMTIKLFVDTTPLDSLVVDIHRQVAEGMGFKIGKSETLAGYWTVTWPDDGHGLLRTHGFKSEADAAQFAFNEAVGKL